MKLRSIYKVSVKQIVRENDSRQKLYRKENKNRLTFST